MSDRGGAVMGVAPIGVFKTIDEVCHFAAMQAQITHNTSTGILAAKCGALAVHFGFVMGAAPHEIRTLLLQNLTDFEQSHLGSHARKGKPVSENACEIFNAALDAVEAGTTLSEILRSAVSYMGDTDTVAAVAMAIGSACSVENDLPKHLHDGLENSNYGREYLADLSKRLENLP
jgi:ADP-ribosyl-[dinitrogen reductase] hydrolase